VTAARRASRQERTHPAAHQLQPTRQLHSRVHIRPVHRPQDLSSQATPTSVLRLRPHRSASRLPLFSASRLSRLHDRPTDRPHSRHDIHCRRIRTRARNQTNPTPHASIHRDRHVIVQLPRPLYVERPQLLPRRPLGAARVQRDAPVAERPARDVRRVCAGHEAGQHWREEEELQVECTRAHAQTRSETRATAAEAEADC
jgi:hypothetical protein